MLRAVQTRKAMHGDGEEAAEGEEAGGGLTAFRRAEKKCAPPPATAPPRVARSVTHRLPHRPACPATVLKNSSRADTSGQSWGARRLLTASPPPYGARYKLHKDESFRMSKGRRRGG